MGYCTERSLVKHQSHAITVSTLRCRSWGCAYCAPERVKALKAIANQGQPKIFLTLTIRKSRFPTPDAQARELARGWRMLRQWLCRKLSRKSIPFMAVIEKHKSGWPHLHLLLSTNYIHHDLIRKWWVARFDSPMVFISRLHNPKRAAKYVTKYLSKAPEKFEGVKRYWRSKDYKPPSPEDRRPEHTDDTWWEAISWRPLAMVEAATIDGARVEFRDGRWIITKWWQKDRARWGVG